MEDRPLDLAPIARNPNEFSHRVDQHLALLTQNLTLRGDDLKVSEMLSKAISDSHARTCLMPIEQIQESFRKAQDLGKLLYYKELPQEQLWVECAKNLTSVIQVIIEFAKMVPGFMKLIQDDQIVLLIASSFQVAVVRMSRYFDLQTGCVLCMDAMLPQHAFFTQDTAEQRLVSCIFELARSIAELRLTESELAIYTAVLLLNPDLPGLRERREVRRIQDAVLRALRFELERTRSAEARVTLYDALVAKMPQLRELYVMHVEALAKFRRAYPLIQFPALYTEIFSHDN